MFLCKASYPHTQNCNVACVVVDLVPNSHIRPVGGKGACPTHLCGLALAGLAFFSVVWAKLRQGRHKDQSPLPA